MRFGASRKTDLLSPEEREIVDRFERGAIDAGEAGRLLIESVRRVRDVPAESPEPEQPGAEQPQAITIEAEDDGVPVNPDETPEEAAARELVERIAREVDAELGR